MPVSDRTRSLTRINDILSAPGLLQSAISARLPTRSHLNVLEIGFGWGCALLELAWQFRQDPVTLFGVDAKQAPPVESRDDLAHIAEQFEIIPAQDLPGFQYPEIHFYDATRLHFDDESMDVVYSAVTIRFIKRKAEFLEEVCRILRPGGQAILHISEPHWDYPYGPISDERILAPYTNRFVLKHGEELIPLPVYLKLFEEESYRFRFTTSGRCVLFVSKLKPGLLSLKLRYNETLSMRGRKLPLLNEEGEVRGGFRTVYDVPEDMYCRLFEEGLLCREQPSSNGKGHDNSPLLA